MGLVVTDDGWDRAGVVCCEDALKGGGVDVLEGGGAGGSSAAHGSSAE